MRIAIAGATGFVGSRLVARLKEEGRHEVIALTREAGRRQDEPGLTWRECDLFSLLEIEGALKGADAGIYLVHSMLPSARLVQGSFADFDLILADNFARAARHNGLRRLFYLGGLIPDTGELSPHLASRREVEEVLGASGVPLTTFRAGLVIGAGGSSFTIMMRLVERLPVMISPAWTRTTSQPVALDDVVNCFVRALDDPATESRIYDLGNMSPLSYLEMMEKTAELMGYRRRFWRFPFFTPALSRLWVSVVTGAPKSLVYPLIQSLKNPMTASPNRQVPSGWTRYATFTEAVEKAIAEERAVPRRSRKKPRAFLRALRKRGPSTVRSVQRLPLPDGMRAQDAAELYLEWLPKFLRHGVWVERQGNLALFQSPLSRRPLLVLRRSPERSTVDRQLFYVEGGVLASGAERGRLEFREVLGEPVLIAATHDFVPRLPWWLYKITQAPVHVWVMRSFGRFLVKSPHPHFEATSPRGA